MFKSIDSAGSTTMANRACIKCQKRIEEFSTKRLNTALTSLDKLIVAKQILENKPATAAITVKYQRQKDNKKWSDPNLPAIDR